MNCFVLLLFFFFATGKVVHPTGTAEPGAPALRLEDYGRRWFYGDLVIIPPPPVDLDPYDRMLWVVQLSNDNATVANVDPYAPWEPCSEDDDCIRSARQRGMHYYHVYCNEKRCETACSCVEDAACPLMRGVSGALEHGVCRDCLCHAESKAPFARVSLHNPDEGVRLVPFPVSVSEQAARFLTNAAPGDMLVLMSHNLYRHVLSNYVFVIV